VILISSPVRRFRRSTGKTFPSFWTRWSLGDGLLLRESIADYQNENHEGNEKQ